MTSKVFAAKMLLLVAGIVIAGTLMLAHCTTTVTNSLGAVISDIDPNVSLVASLLGGEVHEDRDGREGFNLRLHPLYMYGLFDESVMFCGDVRSMLEGKKAAFQVYTYRRAASRLIDGIPCHALVGVDDIVKKKGLN
jgi:hypothetical protein